MKLTLQIIPFSLLTLSFALAPAPSKHITSTLAHTKSASPKPTTSTLQKPKTNIPPPHRYYLRTSVIGKGNSDKNGLYVSGYHIGAGQNDATLESIDSASVGFLNGTQQQFDYGTDFPWGMMLKEDSSYAEWDFVEIDVGYGTEGFFFNKSGLQVTTDDHGFEGWLACDWWHGVPQLFWRPFKNGDKLPTSCAPVNLMPVAVKNRW